MSRTKPPQQPRDDSWLSLAQRHIPLVRYVMRKLTGKLPPSADRDDLFAAGSLGLIEAARRYDPSRNVPFHSYAIPRIWGAILDELRSRDWLSQDMREKVKRLQHGRAAIRRNDGTPPSHHELAEHLKCSVERVARLSALADTPGPQPSGNDWSVHGISQDQLYARRRANPPRDPYQEAVFKEQKQLLAAAIADLPERERAVILLRYHEALYLHEIGRLLGVSESRVCQIHAEAMQRLRRRLRRKGAVPVNAPVVKGHGR